MNTDRKLLPATESLLAEIAGKADFHIIDAYKNAVLCFGSKADADELLKKFLEEPTEPFSEDLLEIIGQWGDEKHAREIFNCCITDIRLNENFPEAVLEVLGRLKFEPAKPVLAHYAFRSSQYYLNRSAVLGLLHFDCREYQQEIKNAVTGVLSKNTFPEFLPALVCKLENRKELLDQLFHSGSTTISTDCNAGIFLGFALCGKDGKKYFKEALFDPNWEAFYNAARMVVKGMDHLEISFEELLQEATLIKDEKVLQYYMLVLISLLEIKVKSYENSGESFEKIYRSLFVTKLFLILAEKAGQEDDAEKLEELLILRMKEEVMLRNRR
ncbi:hypothetical protein [Salinimicrobium xinjiangense]|uniref:hypothetical protein n=1 Tax=Salinimicrobium xinjiangense TaxID=438596 RepID=UPI0005612407|nr:hypothetical protein [Salinimicrobium xinjiangense]